MNTNTKEHRESVVKVCGSIAGIPKSLTEAWDAINDAIRRSEVALSEKGILTDAQHARLHDVKLELMAAQSRIMDGRHVIDGMIAAGIAVVEKPKTEVPMSAPDLF